MPPKKKNCLPTGKNVKAYGEMVKPNSMNAPTPKSIKKRPIDKSANPPTKKSLQLVQDSEKLIQSSSVAIANKILFFQERIKAVDNLLKTEQSASAKAKLKEIKMALEQELEKLMVAQQQGITDEPALFGDIPGPPSITEPIERPKIPELMDAPFDEPFFPVEPLKPDDPAKRRSETEDPLSRLSGLEADEEVLERILRERFSKQPPPQIPEEWKNEPMNTIADIEEVFEQQGKSLNTEDLNKFIESQDKPIKDLTADNIAQFVEPEKPKKSVWEEDWSFESETPKKKKSETPEKKSESEEEFVEPKRPSTSSSVSLPKRPKVSEKEIDKQREDRIESLIWLIEQTEDLRERATDESQIKSLDDSLYSYRTELAELQEKKESKKGKEKAKMKDPFYVPTFETSLISEEQKKIDQAFSKLMRGEITQAEYDKIEKGTTSVLPEPKRDSPRTAFLPAEGSQYFDEKIDMKKKLTLDDMRKLFDKTLKDTKKKGDKKGLIADILENMGIQQMEVGDKGLTPLEFENQIFNNKIPFKEVRWNVKFFRIDVKDLISGRQAEPKAMAVMLEKWKRKQNFDEKGNSEIDRLAVMIYSAIVQDTPANKIVQPYKYEPFRFPTF